MRANNKRVELAEEAERADFYALVVRRWWRTDPWPWMIAMTQPVTGSTELLAWADVFKLVAGFGFSLILIWAKSAGERLYRFRSIKRSAWNVAKHHTTFTTWLGELAGFSAAEKEGGVWLSSVDFNEHYTKLVAELSQLDPKHSDVYIEYLGAEQVVRNGFERLDKLRFELIKVRNIEAPTESEKSIRRVLTSQCTVVRLDLQKMAERELKVLELIQIKRSDSVDPIDALRESIRLLASPTK